MKTTLDLNDRLLTDAKALAAHQQTTLTRLIEEGLQMRLRVRDKPATRTAQARLPVSRHRGGLVAGIEPLSNRSLYDAADNDA